MVGITLARHEEIEVRNVLGRGGGGGRDVDAERWVWESSPTARVMLGNESGFGSLKGRERLGVEVME